MPYKEKGRTTWRGKVTIKGQRRTKRCKSKKAALAWEHTKKKELAQPMIRIIYMSLHKAASDYLTYCETQYSRTTYLDKRKAIGELITASGLNIPIDQIEPNAVLNEIILKQATPNLSNKRRKDLHAFFEHCRKFHGLRYNPVDPIDKIPQNRALQPVPTDAELAKLLLKCGNRQDKNMINAFVHSGARKSELMRITFSQDVDFKGPILRLGNRKNHSREMKYRFIPMNDTLYDALMSQFRHRLPHSDFVFQNREKDNPRYGQRYVSRQRFIELLCRRAGVKPMGYHALRRYFASKLLENGEDLKTISLLLGHATVTTTDKYIYHLKTDLRSAVQRLEQKGSVITLNEVKINS